MRAILTPEIAPMSGVVLFRPGNELLWLFRQGRVVIETPSEAIQHLPSGIIPEAHQPLTDDDSIKAIFENERVIRRAGGLDSLDAWLERKFECQWPHKDWHARDFTVLRHVPGSIRLCWGCDNELRHQTTERLAGIAKENLVQWLIERVNSELGFNAEHTLTIPEFCWWMVRSDLADLIPEYLATKALRIKPEAFNPVMRESDIVPSLSATHILQEKAMKVVTVKVDPESPESFMLRPKRRRWENEKYTRWVKTQQCSCCNNPADDPHHLIGHGQGGMGTKAHDLFVIPLCRAHHDELHADPVAFEAKYGDQLVLLFRFLDRALAIGVLA